MKIIKKLPFYTFSQNDEDEWHGFSEKVSEAGYKTVQKSASMKKSKSSADDFSALDVKSTVSSSKPVKTKKEEDDIWEILNS